MIGWQTKMNKTRPLTFENLTQGKRDELTKFQNFHATFSDGDLSHNQNAKQKVSFHKFIISHWYKSKHVRVLKYVKISQAVKGGKQT